MSAVRIIQLLCPERHCLFMVAYQTDDGQAVPTLAEKARAFYLEKAHGDGACGICRSRDLNTEDGLTIWATTEEAKPYLMELQQRQIAARRFIDASRS